MYLEKETGFFSVKLYISSVGHRLAFFSLSNTSFQFVGTGCVFFVILSWLLVASAGKQKSIEKRALFVKK